MTTWRANGVAISSSNFIFMSPLYVPRFYCLLYTLIAQRCSYFLTFLQAYCYSGESLLAGDKCGDAVRALQESQKSKANQYIKRDKRFIGPLFGQLIDILSTNWQLIDHIVLLLIYRSIDWLIDWLILDTWSFGWLIDWIVESGFFDLLIYWLIDWLIDWLHKSFSVPSYWTRGQKI